MCDIMLNLKLIGLDGSEKWIKLNRAHYVSDFLDHFALSFHEARHDLELAWRNQTLGEHVTLAQAHVEDMDTILLRRKYEDLRVRGMTQDVIRLKVPKSMLPEAKNKERAASEKDMSELADRMTKYIAKVSIGQPRPKSREDRIPSAAWLDRPAWKDNADGKVAVKPRAKTSYG